MKNLLCISLCVLLCLSCQTEKPKADYFVVHRRTSGNQYLHSITNAKNDTILRLNPDTYWVCFSDTVEHFLVVAPKHRKGWWAIDLNENFLFQVYNTSPGEPSPDELTFNKIRIVDETGKIGFADEHGNIVIKPAFESVTAFYQEYAIIGKDCRKIPWDTLHADSGDEHYSIVCSQNGYINTRGEIIELGNSTFEELREKLHFPEQ